jgi:undecaprenyl-diphosphatase
MDLWQAIILGIVEGLTEYLPVSSTGHLILAQRLMGIPQDEASDAYAICIQAGAIAAVLGIYWKRVKQMIMGVLGKDPVGLSLAINVMIAFMPAAIVGVLLKKQISIHLMKPWPIVAAWIVGGAIILWYEWGRKGKTVELGKGVEQIDWRLALGIGLFQCLGMWPGTSRSLVTILAGLFLGLRMAAAVEFSFILGLLTLTAATAYDGIKHGKTMVHEYGPLPIVVGFVFAAISAAVAVKWMVAYLNKHGLAIFGYYRIAVGVFVAGLILSGWTMMEQQTPAPTADSLRNAPSITVPAGP